MNFSRFSNELKQTLRLAFPIVLAQVGMMTMGLVDTIVSGHISTETLAGVGLAASFFGATVMVSSGFLHALDAFFSQAMGANREDIVKEHLEQGLWNALILTVTSTTLMLIGGQVYVHFAANAKVAEIFLQYLHICAWCIPTVFFFKVLERYWQSAQVASPFAWIIVISNVLNLFFDLALGLGWWGFPKLGAEGIAWSTVINRYWALAALLIFTIHRNGMFPWRLPRWNQERMRSFWRLAFPTGAQIGLEVGAFISMSFVAGAIGAVELATHQVVLNVASFSFMFALGFHSVAAVRVGRWTGAGDPEAAQTAGWLVIAINALIMGAFCILFISVPALIMGWFTPDQAVIALGSKVLLIAGIFQISDGVQTAATGALRGLGDAVSSLRVNALGHYLVGIPLGITLCFGFDMGVQGLWMGAAAGLTVVALILCFIWKKKSLQRSAILG